MNYSTIPTVVGAAKLRNASLLGQKVDITRVAFGDGDGAEYEPTGQETALKKQVYECPPNRIEEEAGAPTWIELEAVIPHNVGGWYLREVGCFDDDGDLIFIGNLPSSFKPSGEAGVIKDLVFEMVYDAVAADVVQIKIDPNVVIATRKYVNDINELHQSDNFAHEKPCGWKGVYENAVIPLVPKPMAGQKLNRSEVNGRLKFRRGGATSSLYNTVVDLVCASSYSDTQAYSFVLQQKLNTIVTKLVTFDLDGQTWIGLVAYAGNPEARISFHGSFENNNSFTNHQLKVIPYYNNQTSTVLNAEINDSMADYVSPDEPLLFGLHKIYHEGNLSQVLARLEGGQGLPWDANRVYKTGEICTVEINGEVIPMQMYAGPNLTCKGKNPANSANRHEGWTDNTLPFWWIPYTGDQVGMPFFWLDSTPPEWAVMEINVDLPTAVYWRLARRYPHLVSGGTINTGEIRGEFLRVLDQGRGVNPSRQINTFENHSLQHHNHLLPTGSGASGSGLWGVNDQYWMQADGVNWSPTTGSIAISGHYGQDVSLSPGGSWSAETRPRNVSRAMAIVI